MLIQAIVGLTEPKIQAAVISSVIAAGEKSSLLIHTKVSSGLKYFKTLPSTQYTECSRLESRAPNEVSSGPYCICTNGAFVGS